MIPLADALLIPLLEPGSFRPLAVLQFFHRALNLFHSLDPRQGFSFPGVLFACARALFKCLDGLLQCTINSLGNVGKIDIDQLFFFAKRIFFVHALNSGRDNRRMQ
jgi:hypothetical protein